VLFVEILILFIIMMVISSILKSFRGTDSGRAYTPPAQRPQRREIPFPPELFGLPEEEREEEKEPPVELYFPERSGYWPEVEVPVKKAPVQVKEEPSLHEPSLHLEKKLPRKASPSSKSPRTRPGGPRPAREEERDMGRPLQELLNGEKLPLAIIAAEVFSAPRARRPFR
jgi:hypothetical protein